MTVQKQSVKPPIKTPVNISTYTTLYVILPCPTSSRLMCVTNIQPDQPIIRDVGMQIDMFLTASSLIEPSTPVSATTFSFTNEEEI